MPRVTRAKFADLGCPVIRRDVACGGMRTRSPETTVVLG